MGPHLGRGLWGTAGAAGALDVGDGRGTALGGGFGGRPGALFVAVAARNEKKKQWPALWDRRRPGENYRPVDPKPIWNKCHRHLFRSGPETEQMSMTLVPTRWNLKNAGSSIRQPSVSVPRCPGHLCFLRSLGPTRAIWDAQLRPLCRTGAALGSSLGTFGAIFGPNVVQN